MFPFGKNKVMPVSVREFVSGKKEAKIENQRLDDPKYSITVEEANAIASGDFSKPAIKEPEKEEKKKSKLSINKYILYGLVGAISLVAIIWFVKHARKRKFLTSGNKTQNGKNSNISYAKI